MHAQMCTHVHTHARTHTHLCVHTDTHVYTHVPIKVFFKISIIRCFEIQVTVLGGGVFQQLAGHITPAVKSLEQQSCVLLVLGTNFPLTAGVQIPRGEEPHPAQLLVGFLKFLLR